MVTRFPLGDARNHAIDLARRPDAASPMATVHDRKARTQTRLDADTILRHRDAERR